MVLNVAILLIIYIMKIAFLIVTFLVSSQLFSQKAISKNASTVTDNISFFDNSDFTLEYFLVNGERENLVLNHPTGTGFFPFPNLNFAPYIVTNQLEADELGAFCNGGNALYEYTDTYLKLITGVRTLTDPCSITLNQETRFFNIVQAWDVEANVAIEIFYDIISDQTGFWLWTDENEKLFFTKTTLGVEDIDLDKLVKIYPNPTSNYLNIKSSIVVITKISVFDLQGKNVLIKINNLDSINVSNLNRGIYFLKLETNQFVLTKKIMLR